MARTHQTNGHERQEPETLPQASGNGQSAPSESVEALGNRFAQKSEGAATIRELFAYADSSVVFGNGQWPHVPAHFDESSVDTRKARLALALEIARGSANNFDDSDLGAIVAKAEQGLANGDVMPSLLEEAVDDYFYRLQKMSREEKKAQGVTANMGGLTSFADRTQVVNMVLGYAVGENKVVPQGMPEAGRPWIDVVTDSIKRYIAEQRPENKKAAKESKAAATRDGSNAVTALLG